MSWQCRGTFSCEVSPARARSAESLTKSPIAPNPLPATTLSAETCVSIAVVPKLERAFNFETDVICVFLGKDGAENIGEDEANHLRAHIELYWQEVEVVLVGWAKRERTEPSTINCNGPK